MRLALIHYTKPPTVGGVERVMDDQAAILRSLGHEVVFLTARDKIGTLSDFEGVIVHNVFTMPFDPELTRRLHEMAAAWPHGRWLNWVHDIAAINPAYAHMPWCDPPYEILTQPPPNCLHVTVSEERRRQYSTATGLPPEHIRVFTNGVDTWRLLGLSPSLRHWVTSLDLFRRDLVLLHPARMVRRKNIEMAIQLVNTARAAEINVAYLVTAAPDPHNADQLAYAHELAALSDGLGLSDHVFFIGQQAHVSEEDLRGLYQISDLLFFPSTSEGFGLPLLEAAVHALPVYCSDIPVHREVAAVEARFFALNEHPAELTSRIMADPIVGLRRSRRRLCWESATFNASARLDDLLKSACTKKA